ncbi:MAG: thiamine pyrophosphate-dependent enzyme [Proteobacteria bacterium]|nr:thiamine pyrophosphate-dependent enzyme [Pseudomonadota bacterium]
MHHAEINLVRDIEPSAEELKLAYRIGVRSRAVEEYIVRLVSRGEVKFAIWGPGEEVHGTATALALSKVVNPDHFGVVPHYRSGAMCSMWCELNGYDQFVHSVVRQQFSRETDRMSRGRQMVNHIDIREVGLLPVQSPVGMQLGKAAGYAMGFLVKGIDDGVAMAVIGDGTSAESDLHEAMNAASVWNLPLIVLVTDNNVAISTLPEEGRGIKDFNAYAAAFGFEHFECDGRNFWDSFQVTLDAARYVRQSQRPALIHAKNLPRFNGHSSAADVTFDLSQDDPLIGFGQKLVQRGLLADADVLRRKTGEGRDFFSHHILGNIMQSESEEVRRILEQVRTEPTPRPESIYQLIYPPFPEVAERPGQGQTNISYAGAIRAALDRIISEHNGVIWGQDVGRLGGVMTATAGLKSRHPDRVFDAPLNEPLIVGTACGAGLHRDLVTVPEIQFGDYSLNAFHWLVHMGNIYWSSAGNSRFATIVRMPVDPFEGGAVYHSMSVDGYFAAIPGMVIIMPSTSYDAYGLLMTAAEYRSSVICLEPKFAYRLSLGPAFPGEPTDRGEIAAMRKQIMRGGIPQIHPGVRVPFGKAAVRREGSDVTLVAWGRAVWTGMKAAESLAEEGIELEVIDLRTLVPPDLDTVFDSVSRTGRLVVAAEDRPFAGFVRSIQGAVVERFPALPTRAIGQKNVPGIGQSPILEEVTALNAGDITRAAHEVLGIEATQSAGWCWIPPRYLD